MSDEMKCFHTGHETYNSPFLCCKDHQVCGPSVNGRATCADPDKADTMIAMADTPFQWGLSEGLLYLFAFVGLLAMIYTAYGAYKKCSKEHEEITPLKPIQAGAEI